MKNTTRKKKPEVAEVSDVPEIVPEPVFEDQPTGSQEITITKAAMNPILLHVHGVGVFTMRAGETVTLPIEAVSALAHTDGVEFTTTKD